MTMRNFAWLTFLVILGLPAVTRADGSPKPTKHCPKPSYSPLHYWVPQLYRVVYQHHVPPGLYAVNESYSHLQPRFVICPYPCPPVPAADRCSPYLAPPASAPIPE